ncbi:MAG TPA: class I SAM-dependent methyltransferase [Candidatus Nanoarchaeia archaeon]|nr:class I SAM-dependent methyltransferase [Candidatus Nanoarchaeia archaeon]
MVLFSRPHYSDSWMKNFVFRVIGYPHVGTRIRGNAVFKLVNFPKDAKVLEIGSGSGFFSFELRKRGYAVSSTDPLIGITTKDIDRLHTIFQKAGYQFQFTKGDARKLPFKANTFDAIVIADVIEHIKEEDKVMQEMRRVLKLGGVFVASTPSTKFHEGKFKPFFRWFKDHTFLGRLPVWNEKDIYKEKMMQLKGHLREYTYDDWKRLCDNHGFVIEQAKKEYKFFGALAVELHHTFNFVHRYASVFFFLLYPFTFLDKLIPCSSTGIALRCRKDLKLTNHISPTQFCYRQQPL